MPFSKGVSSVDESCPLSTGANTRLYMRKKPRLYMRMVPRFYMRLRL